MGCSPWGHKELDTTEYACMHAPMRGVNCPETLTGKRVS